LLLLRFISLTLPLSRKRARGPTEAEFKQPLLTAGKEQGKEADLKRPFSHREKDRMRG